MPKNYGLNLDSRLSASLEYYYQREAQNNIFNTYPTLKYLFDNRREMDGGESISAPITYLKNNNVASITPYQTLDTTAQDNETTVNDRIRTYAAPITISLVELDENSGVHKIFDLAEQKATNAMWTTRDQLSTDLWAATQSGQAVNTFQQLSDTTTTIHSLAAASYWQGTTTASGSFAAQGLDDMRITFNKAANEGAEPPTFIVTGRAEHEFFERYGTTKQYVIPPTSSATDLNLGFNSLYFRGVPVIYDLKAPSGQMYFINTNFTKLCVSMNHSFKIGPFIQPANALVKTAIISLRTQLFTVKRVSIGKMTSITA